MADPARITRVGPEAPPEEIASTNPAAASPPPNASAPVGGAGSAIPKDAAAERGIDLPAAEEFASHTGKGVQAIVDGARVLVGKPAFLAQRGVDLSRANDAARLEARGQTVIAVTSHGALLGLIGITDAVKDDAADAVRRIKNAGLTPVMITGDNERTARAVAEQVGIEEVLAQALPDAKAARVRALQQEGRRVAMVGDGINDAPALTQADVGIAIGAGTDIAIESADIVIMGDRLSAVMDNYEIGRRSYTKTKQNLTLAFAFNGVGVPLAATGLVHPVWAMVASVTTVLTNSFAGGLLRRTTAGRKPRETETPAEETENGLRLQVGMHCAGCAQNISASLPQIDGVRSAVADHETGAVEIVHLERKVSEDEICEHLRELGYDVTGHREHGLITQE